MFKFPSEKLKNQKVKISFKENIEPQEIFLDKLAKEKEEKLGVPERKLEVPLSGKIFQVFLAIFIISILILFGRTFQFQVIEHKFLSSLAERNKFIIHSLQASRGVIYDREGNQLVFNKPYFDLVLNKKELPQKEGKKIKVLKKVSPIIKKEVGELKTKIEQSKSPQVLISENLDHQTLIILETKINELPGFQIKRNQRRNYKHGSNFSHLLGYTGKIKTEELKADSEFYSIFDWVGREGIEKSYEKILRKNPGRLLKEHDALGNLISQKITQLPQSGKSLVLWLDSDLQKKIKKELEKKIKKVKAKGGAAVALDPKTGGILSLISLPTFDNNLFSQGMSAKQWKKINEEPQKPLFNRAIAGQYLIGSTIKPLIAAAALQEKIISPTKKINCQGFITIPNPYLPEKETKKADWTVHGQTDLKKAIAESCNVYFYTIGGGWKDQEGLGPTKIKKYLQLFGLGKILKSDLLVPEWAKGLVPDPEWKKKKKGEYWWDGDTYNLSIGQGYILVTPLQVAAAFSTLINGGKLVQPQAVWKIVDDQKNLIKEIKPKIIGKNFIDPKNLQIVKQGMRWAVTGQNSPRASAVLLNDLPVSAGAKTGTAQVGKKGGKDYYNIWICAFAPYEHPQIVLTLVLEKVKGLRAHQIIVPVAKEILNWYFSQL